ncbi:helix-turn-helix transcriptional regulator [Streptomyces sp. NPDC047085]|jgi:DNA-binding transcriptional ArsR family regulator|uniref:ArsR/SmtB family transcription factor n=1 Tax=Streptomyces sp. NPDC047085 TaxID=3155140 RepID=UPI0033E045DF
MPDLEGHPALEEMDLRAVLNALADPLRYGVISALLREPEGTARTCASFNLPVSKSTTTHHFRILRESGLVRQVDRGNSRAATLRKDDLDKRFPGLLDLIRANP